jgi:hypothetical protein
MNNKSDLYYLEIHESSQLIRSREISPASFNNK